MKRTRLAILIVGVSVMLAAEPVCRRIVFPVAHRHHSKATLAKWAEWNKTHVPPTPKQVLAEIDLACPQLALLDSMPDFVLPSDSVPAPVWMDQEVVPDTAVLAEVTERPQLALVESSYTLPALPLPADSVPAAAPVPEPASVWLLLVGFVGLGWIKWRAANAGL